MNTLSLFSKQYFKQNDFADILLITSSEKSENYALFI